MGSRRVSIYRQDNILNISGEEVEKRVPKSPYTFSCSPRALFNNRKMMSGG